MQRLFPAFSARAHGLLAIAAAISLGGLALPAGAAAAAPAARTAPPRRTSGTTDEKTGTVTLAPTVRSVTVQLAHPEA